MPNPRSTAPLASAYPRLKVLDGCRARRIRRSVLTLPLIKLPPLSERTHSTDGTPRLWMSARKRGNIAVASDFCTKYVHPSRKKLPFTSMVYRAPPADLVGFGPDRFTNTRCSGRDERDEIARGIGLLMPFDIEHPVHVFNSPLDATPNCLTVSHEMVFVRDSEAVRCRMRGKLLPCTESQGIRRPLPRTTYYCSLRPLRRVLSVGRT